MSFRRRQTRRQQQRRRFYRQLTAVFLAAFLLFGITSPAMADDDLPNPDPGDVTAQWTVDKEASATEVVPGENFEYTITVGCSAISDVGCRGAITTDVIPEPLVIDDVTVGGGGNAHAEPVIDGQKVTVEWTEEIAPGVPGMLDNTTAQITIQAHVPEDISYDYNGVELVNDATAEATNAEDVTDTAVVTPVIPLNLATTASKSFDPTSTLAAAGTPVDATLGGTNDSNATVDTLTIQDPVDPTAAPNPFDYLAFTGFGTVTPPEGATGTTYEVYVDGEWIEAPEGNLPDGVDAADVKGTRVTFTGEIPTGASATVPLELETTDLAVGEPEDTVVNNTVQSEVALDTETATDVADADFTLNANAVDVTATKSFDPDLVVAGESSTATIGGTNASSIPIDSMTITEPSTGSFPEEYTFNGITGPITYPAGATSGTVIYQPSGEEVPFADGETPAPPTGDPADVTSFEVVFTGDIQPGAETSIPFEVSTDADLGDTVDLPTTVNNEVAVHGENDGAEGDATADDDLIIYDEVIEPYIDKQIRPSQIIASPGEVVTISLQGGTTERPNPPDQPDGTTGNADQIVIQEPLDPIEGNAWWNAFDLDTIAQTPIPADATLTVEYYDTTDGTWKTLDGPIAGPTIYSYDVPDDISAVAGGVRFVYDYTGDQGGFAPGTDLEPNFTATLRGEGRYDGEAPPFNTDPEQPNTTIPNCAQADATSPTEGVDPGHTEMDPADCPEIEILPLDGPGVGDLIEKDFGQSSSGGDKTVFERSGDTIPSTLHWSTGGYSNLETVELTDITDPETTDVADSMYDAFNLTRINAINDGNDPYIKYDQVTNVELWDGTGWTEAANSPCDTGGCIGQMPAIDLTDAEQESTLSVRLTFAESPNRADVIEGDLDAPPVGSGVARSIDNDRNVTMVWQVRDTKRSDGSPALAVDDYNTADPGVVHNEANGTGFPQDGDPITDNDGDDVVINDAPITTTTDKTWDGGPVGVPEEGTPEDEYPLTEMTVNTVNTTPAMVDQMQITDTAPGTADTPETDPFQAFRLNNFAAITVPEGTVNTTVTLSCAGGDPVQLTREEALALTPETMPCDVSGVQVLFDGRIASGGEGVLSLDMRLRPTWRDSGELITPDDGPISNTAQGIVADVDAIQDCPPPDDARFACDQGNDTIDLNATAFGITAGKSIDPASQKPGDQSPVTVTVSAQNSGNARPYLDEITDDDPTFWNAVDFVGMDPSWTLPEPVEFVQACYLDGGDFTAANVEGDSVGGDWTCQELPGGGPPFEDGDLTLDQAVAFMNAAPEDIHGVRFRFMAGNETGWQNPANPLIEVPFQVERRDDLRTGGPVPTTRADQEAAPGEEAAGIFNDTVEVYGESVLVGPDLRLDDEATADDDYTYQHLTQSVEVNKTPTGEVEPGTVIPFTMTYTNTGEGPLTNPVFVDELPTDADGRQLIFDPDSDPAIVSPYSFALEGAAPEPPNGSALPTDEAGNTDQIDIGTSGADDEVITFTMPDGTVLEPGQTYTITIDLMLRPGLTPDDVITNTTSINADEPFDTCAPNTDEETGACWDDTQVSPQRVAALSTVKKVKHDEEINEPGIPEVFLDESVVPDDIEVPEDYCDTAADEDGFYRAPCVPVTLPGQTETWKFEVTNTGTLPIDELVSMDNLPTPGDTGLIVTLPRGSEWAPTFVGGLQVDSSGHPNAEIQTFYSTSSTPCTDDLDPMGPQCPEGSWLPYDESVDPAQVASLKIQVNFADGELFLPGESVSIQGQTETTPETAVESDYPVAWNTVATGGVSNDNGTRGTVPATEGRKVGVSYPTGPIELQKTVSGPGAEFAPDTFEVQPTCTSVGGDITGLDPVTLTPGADPTQVTGLPWGAECTATESDHGQTSQIIGTATVGGPDDEIGLVSIENVYTVGPMSVTKSVSSDAVDQDGEPIAYGPFEVEVQCTFLDEPVYAEGYGPDNPMVHQFTDGETWDLTGLPTGATCTTIETDPADAAEVIITEEEIEIGNGPDELVEVQVENSYDVGSLLLQKEVDGDAAQDPDLADGPFTLHLTCTLDDASGQRTVYDDDIVLEGQPPLQAQVDNLAAGSDCTVTETDAGGATDVTIAPETVTIGADETVNVMATNHFDAGSLSVTKSRVGPGANLYGVGPFEVELSCTYENAAGEDVPLEIPGGATRELSQANSYTADYDPLLIGAECRLEETQTGGATSTEIVDADGEPIDTITIDDSDEPIAVEVVNTFDVGQLEVTKSMVGPGAELYGAGPFEVELACTRDVNGEQVDVFPPGGATRELNAENDYTASYQMLPIGAECQLTETQTGGATSTEIIDADGEPIDTITIDDSDEPIEIGVENTFEVGELSVNKSMVGPGAELYGAGPFEVELACTWAPNGEQQPIDIPGGATRDLTADNDYAASYELLPIGAECQLTETETGGATSTEIVDGSGDPIDTVTIDDSQEPIEIGVENTFDVGGLSVAKSVEGPGAEQYGAGPFEVELSCTREVNGEEQSIDIPGGATRELSEAGDYAADYELLPIGAECELTEPVDGGATSTEIVDSDGEPVESFTIDSTDEPFELNVVNTFEVGSLVLRKFIPGAAAEDPDLADGPFTLHVMCTLSDASGERTVYDEDVVLEGEAPLRAEIDGLPADAECEVTETDPGGATEHIIVPETVTIQADDTVRVVATNLFRAGSVQVSKTMDGPGADQYGAGPFEVELSCTYQDVDGNDVPLSIPDGSTRELNEENDYSAEYDPLLVGAECQLTETETGGATSTQIVDADGEPVDTFTINNRLEPVQLEVINTFEVGQLDVTKSMVGPGAELYGAGPYEVELSCTRDVNGETQPFDIPGGSTRDLNADNSYAASYGQLPIGAECELTETQTGGSTSTQIVDGEGQPIDTILIDDNTDPIQVGVENTFDVGQLAVTKSMVGAGAEAYGSGPFQVELSCLREVNGEDQPFDIPGGATRELNADNDYTAAYELLPIGADCELTEPIDGGATSTEIVDGAGEPIDTIAIDTSTEPIEVGVVNTFDVGTLTLLKQVDGDASSDPELANGPFTMHVMCTLSDASGSRTVFDQDVVLEGDPPITQDVGNLPVDAECTVTETDPGGATDVTIEPETVTIGADEPVEVTATNHFDAGSVTVTKSMIGPGADRYGTGPFEVSLTCSYQDVAGNAVPLAIPGGATRELTADNEYTADYGSLLLGANCQLAETGTGGATQSEIVDAEGEPVADFTIDDTEEAVQLEVINTFNVGAVQVTKQVTGDSSADGYTVELQCVQDVNGTAIPVDIPDGAERTLATADDLTATYEDLPTGADCTLTETDNGGAANTVITPNNGDPSSGVVQVGDGTTAELNVLNEFPTATPEPPEPSAPPSADPPPDGDLPDTGANGLTTFALVAGGLLILTGIVLLVRRRRS